MTIGSFEKYYYQRFLHFVFVRKTLLRARVRWEE